MKLPNDVKKIICDLLMEMVIEWSCDEFDVENTEENREFVKTVYGHDYDIGDGNIYLSLYSILKYWRDNETL